MNLFAKKAVGAIIGLTSIAIVFAAFNAILVGGQKLWHHSDQAKLDAIKTTLKIEKSDLTAKESTLRRWKLKMQQEDTAIAQLKAEVDGVESEYPDGIPASLYVIYQNNII